MEKLLDVSRGTPSLENRLPISKYWGIVKEFGISWGERWVTQKAMFCFVKGTCCPRSNDFFRGYVLHFKVVFSGQRVWHCMEKCWMVPRAEHL